MLTIRIHADEGALVGIPGRLTQLARSFSDLRPYWPFVTTTVREILSEAMESEGSSTRAGKWKALSARYGAWKARRYPGAKILELTGRLKASLIGGPEQRVMASPTSLTIESLVPYGGYHQRGGGLLPRRAPWSPTSRDAFRITAALSQKIRKDITSKFAGYTRVT